MNKVSHLVWWTNIMLMCHVKWEKQPHLTAFIHWCEFFCMQVVQVPHSDVPCHATGSCKRFSTATRLGWSFLHSWDVLWDRQPEGDLLLFFCNRSQRTRGVKRSVLIRSVNKNISMQKTCTVEKALYLNRSVCLSVGESEAICEGICVWCVWGCVCFLSVSGCECLSVWLYLSFCDVLVCELVSEWMFVFMLVSVCVCVWLYISLCNLVDVWVFLFVSMICVYIGGCLSESLCMYIFVLQIVVLRLFQGSIVLSPLSQNISLEFQIVPFT